MRKRRYHTPMNLLLEPEMYQSIKMIATLQKITMSRFIREGIKLRLVQYDKENNSMTVENPTDKEE